MNLILNQIRMVWACDFNTYYNYGNYIKFSFLSICLSVCLFFCLSLSFFLSVSLLLSLSLSISLSLSGHIQVSQVPIRHEPDSDGEINYPFMFHSLYSLGYKGWIGCEYNPKGMKSCINNSVKISTLILARNQGSHLAFGDGAAPIYAVYTIN